MRAHRAAGTFNYDPVRRRYGEIFQVHTGLLGSVGRPKRSDFEMALARSCPNAVSEKANLGVGLVLFDWASDNKVESRPITLSKLRIGTWPPTFALPYIAIIDGQSFVVGIDPRRSMGLEPNSLNLAFSIMHEETRAADPDLASAGLLIIQTPAVSRSRNSSRRLDLHFYDESIALIEFEEINRVMVEVELQWKEVIRRRRAA